MTTTASLADAAVLLAAWEEASAVPACAAGAVLLHRGGLVDDVTQALDLPLATTAALVARLYTQTFGENVEAVVGCPGCGERLEVALPLARLARVADGPVCATVPAADGGRDLVVRCPTSRDLLAAAASADPAEALLARCVTEAGGGPVAPAALDETQRAAVDAAAEELAGAAAALLRTCCPACGHEMGVDVDVPALLWQRIASEVPAVLAEVAELSAAFGWAEGDVLAMSEVRRSAYLRLVRTRP
ncbi:MAG: hypothetical protein HY830_21675 [Actinobacteria bacterium]|nr:hypothetical protein [Actinomycetota bacterium]